MYYLIKGKMEDEFGCGTFEWVIEAETQEEALAKLEEGEQLESIREISVEERVEREERELLDTVKREYFFRIAGDISIREANKKLRELEADLENYYIALAEFNKNQRLVRILKKNKSYKDWTVGEFETKINQLCNAKTEDEFNKILNGEDKQNG